MRLECYVKSDPLLLTVVISALCNNHLEGSVRNSEWIAKPKKINLIRLKPEAGLILI